MPVRKIPKSFCSLTGRIASRKNNRLISFEAPLEEELYEILELSVAGATSYEEQPIKIAPGGRKGSYTPDVRIDWNGSGKPFFLKKGSTAKPWLVEVKRRTELQEKWIEFRPKFKAAIVEARQRGWLFKIITDKEIRTPFLSNARLLRSAKNVARDAEKSKAILGALSRHRQLTVSELMNILAPTAETRAALFPQLWHLIEQGRVLADLSVPLTMKTRLRVDQIEIE